MRLRCPCGARMTTITMVARRMTALANQGFMAILNISCDLTELFADQPSSAAGSHGRGAELRRNLIRVACRPVLGKGQGDFHERSLDLARPDILEDGPLGTTDLEFHNSVQKSVTL